MASLTDIRNGLKDRLATIPGLNTYATAPGSVEAPAGIVVLPTDFLAFDSTMGRGADDFTLVVLLLVSKADDNLGQINMDPYLAGEGASSVKAVIEADPTLDGVAHFARVASARNYGPVEYANVQYLGVELVVEVTA